MAILKKGIGIESQKTTQTRWNSIVVIEQKVDSKVFVTYPCSDCYIIRQMQSE